MMDEIFEVPSEEVPPVVVDVLPESFPSVSESDGDAAASDPVEPVEPVEPAAPDVDSSEPIEADGAVQLPSSDEADSSEPSTSELLDSFLAGALAGAASPLSEDGAADVPAELVGIETYALSPITASTGLKGVLLGVIGPYDNVVTQYKYQQGNNSYYTYVNEITPDYPWIASAVLFIAMVLSLFALLRRSLSWLK